MKGKKHNRDKEAVLIIGSNIFPTFHIPLAIRLLRRFVTITNISSAWETKAVGLDGQNFINIALQVNTNFDYQNLRCRILRKVEALLGRRRTPNKFTSRTIDIDIVIYDNRIIDDNLWHHSYLAVPVSEIMPDLIDSNTGNDLRSIANILSSSSTLKKRPDILRILV